MSRAFEKDLAGNATGQQEFHELNQFAMKAAGIGAWQLDPATMMITWDDCCSELFGKSIERFLPIDEAFTQVHPDDLNAFRTSIDQALQGVNEGKLDIRCRVIRSHTVPLHWLSFSGRAYFDHQGKPQLMGGVVKDVTTRTEAAMRSDVALLRSEQTLRDAMELAKLSTWKVDIQSGQIEYSERMRHWLGISQSERQLSAGFNSLPNHEKDRVRAALEAAQDPKGDGLFDLEYSIVNQETGRERVIHSQGRTFFDEQGRPFKMEGTALDVTQQRNVRLALEHEVYQRTEELNAANEELGSINEELHAVNDEQTRLNASLEQSNENLQQFAHVASHDLKEPLRKIKIFLSMIEGDHESKLSPRAVQLMHRVHVATNRMFSMINGVLNYSTLNSTGHQAEKVNLNKTLDHVKQELEVLAEQKNALIQCGHFPEIEGAEILLYQLFYNLLINSLKFSRQNVPSVINITASEDGDFLTILVQDNGLGFEQSQAEKIFNMFARLHSKDKYEGTGLGLALCRKIVDRHKGTITAHGKPNEGATFTIVLPIRQLQNII